jgi:hypothetical protein
MTTITPEVRQLPLYEAGRREGRDIGLRIALDVLTKELTRQEFRVTKHDPSSASAARHVFAASILADVAKTIAARFRQ